MCPDTKVGGVDNFQVNLFERQDSLTRITFRRNLQNTGDEGDRVIDKSRATFIVWAIGKLAGDKRPGFHHIYPKHDQSIVFGRKPQKNCFHFTNTAKRAESTVSELAGSSTSVGYFSQTSSLLSKPWGPLRLLNRSMTTFYARIGDAGGLRGYYGSTGHTSPGLVWYINGMLAPVLFVKRGRTYTFRIEGGNNPSKAQLYNPLYIANDPNGGYTEQTDAQRKQYQVYAGIEFDRKLRASPTSAGRLCAWRIPAGNSSREIGSRRKYFDKRRADTNRFQTFVQYRNVLEYQCEPGNAALLQWTPNASTPDIVYYQSYTHANMGNKIVVVDDFLATSYSAIITNTSKSTFDSQQWQLLFLLVMIMIKLL